VRPAGLAIIAMAVAVGLVVSSPALTCDSTACLQQTRGGDLVPRRGALQLDLSFRYTRQNVGMDGSQRIGLVRRPWVDFERQTIWPGFHQEKQGLERFYQVDVNYGLGWGSALQVSVPLYSRRNYAIVHGSAGFDYETRGLGDAVIGLRRGVGSRLVAGLAVKLPSGRSDVQDPYATYILDPMIQPGTGSLDLVGSVQYAYKLAGFDASLTGSYQRTRANRRDYRFGSDLIAGAGFRRRIAGPVSASLQVKGVYKARSTFVGQTVPSTGGQILYVNPGVQVALPRRSNAYAFVPFPAYRDVRDQQLTPRFSLLLGVSKSF
jgi:hypothetical protein